MHIKTYFQTLPLRSCRYPLYSIMVYWLPSNIEQTADAGSVYHWRAGFADRARRAVPSWGAFCALALSSALLPAYFSTVVPSSPARLPLLLRGRRFGAALRALPSCCLFCRPLYFMCIICCGVPVPPPWRSPCCGITAISSGLPCAWFVLLLRKTACSARVWAFVIDMALHCFSMPNFSLLHTTWCALPWPTTIVVLAAIYPYALRCRRKHVPSDLHWWAFITTPSLHTNACRPSRLMAPFYTALRRYHLLQRCRHNVLLICHSNACLASTRIWRSAPAWLVQCRRVCWLVWTRRRAATRSTFAVVNSVCTFGGQRDGRAAKREGLFFFCGTSSGWRFVQRLLFMPLPIFRMDVLTVP